MVRKREGVTSQSYGCEGTRVVDFDAIQVSHRGGMP